MDENQKQVSPWEFLYLTLYAFAGFGVELILVWLEGLIPGWGAAEWQNCLYWAVTALIWGVLCVKLGQWAQKKTGFNWRHNTPEPGEKRLLWALGCTAAAIGLSAWVWGGFKPSIDLERLGWLQLCFQWVYYLFEARLMMLLICFGQRFGESLGGKPYIPWGGVALALTWGLVHVLTQGASTAVYAAGTALLYGGIYLFALHNAKLAYPLVALACLL